MKFCAQCGAQLDDKVLLCPNCQTPSPCEKNKDSNDSKRKKSNNVVSLITINIVLTTLVLIIIIFAIFVLPLIDNSQKNIGIDAETDTENTENATIENSNELNSESLNSVCPANEYGNHDWQQATCIEPAQCENCSAYRDTILGNHVWTTPTCIRPAQCWRCDTYKDDILGNHYFSNENNCCVYCYLSKDEYLGNGE